MELYEYLKAAEEEQRKRLEGADTAAGVIAALGGSGETAFWNGGGDGIDFLFALPPGWDQEWSEASYHWIAKNQTPKRRQIKR